MAGKWKSAMEKLKSTVERNAHKVEVVDLVASVITQCEHLLLKRITTTAAGTLYCAASFCSTFHLTQFCLELKIYLSNSTESEGMHLKK